MSLQHAWSRRPRFTLGQVMASVLAVALLLGILVPTAEPTLRARGRALLDTFLILPAGLTLILALTAGTGPRRHALGRFLAAGPLLVAAVLYFNMVLLALLALLEQSTDPSAVAWRSGHSLGRLTYMAIFPVGYYAMVAVLLPKRCPKCGERALEVWQRATSEELGAPPDVYRCDECDARCWHQPGAPWEVDDRPEEVERAWFNSFAPKLRSMRDEMRPN